MRTTIRSLASALLVPLAVAQNTTSSNTTSSSTEGILSSGEVDLGDWADAYAKATALVAQLTNDEKITIITGGSVTGSSVNWTALEFKDGAEGVQGIMIPRSLSVLKANQFRLQLCDRLRRTIGIIHDLGQNPNVRPTQSSSPRILR